MGKFKKGVIFIAAAIAAFIVFCKLYQQRLRRKALNGQHVKVIVTQNGSYGQQTRKYISMMPSLNGKNPYVPTPWATNKFVNLMLFTYWQ